MSIQGQILRGAGGMRFMYNRNLGLAFVVAVVIHLAVIALYLLVAPADELGASPRLLPLDTISHSVVLLDLSKDEGGGGSPDVDAPLGPSKKGDPNAAPMYDPKSPPTSGDFVPKNPINPKAVKDPKRNDNITRTDKDTVKGPKSGYGEPGQDPNGKGTKLAGGSGGPGVGWGTGEGTGSRGWLRRPSDKAPAWLNETGTVMLSFTILPNGEITNITPAKRGNPNVERAAIENLRKARMRPLPKNVPQTPQRTSMSFKLKLE